MLKVGNYSTNVFIYNIGGKNIPAIKAYHPSCPKGKNSFNVFHKYVHIYGFNSFLSKKLYTGKRANSLQNFRFDILILR